MTRPLVAGLIVLAGLAIRLPHFGDPPLDFHPTRQYRSAVLARAYALDALAGFTEGERVAARLTASRQPTIEPPIMEHLTAIAYRLIGREDLRLPRLLATLSWIAVAVAVFWTAGQLFSGPPAAWAGVAVCLFVPFGIPAGGAFQPDPLMTGMTFVSIAAALTHDRRPVWSRLALLVATGAAAILVKPMAAFFLWPVIAVLAMRRLPWPLGIFFTVAWAVAMALPSVAWYVMVAPDAAEERLFPKLLQSSEFWLDWLRMIDIVVWLPLAALGLIGALFARGRARAVLLALWMGYAILGLTFTYHIHTHTYYSLPLIPIVALSIAGLVQAIDGALTTRSLRRAAAWAGGALLASGLAASIHAGGVLRSSANLYTQAADYARIGTIVGHSTNVASLDDAYGLPLAYHGRIATSNWPLSIDRVNAALSGRSLPPATELLASERADFLVLTNQPELALQPRLAQMLDERFPLLDRGGDPERWRYMVFDLKHLKTVSTVPRKVSFFALTNGSASSHTEVTLSVPQDVTWRVVVPGDAPLRIEPDHGRGAATLALRPVPSSGPIDRKVEILVYVGNETFPTTTTLVRVRTFTSRPDTPPFGAVDKPPPGPLTLDGPLETEGWALDPFDSRGVRIEAVDPTGRTVILGEQRGTLSRPDVAALVPDTHDVFRPGWTFTVEPDALKPLALPIVLHFYSQSGDGRRTEIGVRTISRKGR